MNPYRIASGQIVRLNRWNADQSDGFKGGQEAALRELQRLSLHLWPLQELLYAGQRHKVLVVLQGMDAAGKDGTIRRVFEGVNPQGVRVARFRKPSEEESSHDFLWRAHAVMPASGELVIFNRSYYEDVLVVRVHGLLPKKIWQGRYRRINEFERILIEEGTTILKFCLMIDRDEQAKRLQERLSDPTKQWKVDAADLLERKRWPSYMRAYSEMLRKTSTPRAPWYLIPSNRRWLRDVLVSRVIVETLQGLRMRYPALPARKRSLRVT
jgi:PPK2 family polyphosphate:nucleotide phosphotransferase